MINKIDLRKAISSIAISNAKRNTIYKAFSDLDSITKKEFDSVKSDISKVVESMLTKDTVGKANGVASLDSNGSIPIEQLGNIDTILFLIVRELPTTDIKTNKIYLVPNQDGQGNNIYIEYLYVEGAWEKVGEFKPEVDLSNIEAKIKTKADKEDVDNRFGDLSNYCFNLGPEGRISTPFYDNIFSFNKKIQQLKNNEEYTYADIHGDLDIDEQQFIYDKTFNKFIKIIKINEENIDTEGDFFRTVEPLDFTHTFYLDNEKTGIVENLTQLNIEASNIFVNLTYVEVDDNLDDNTAPQYIYDATDNKWIEVVETYYLSYYYAFNTEEPLDLTHELCYSITNVLIDWTLVGKYSVALGANSSANSINSVALGANSSANSIRTIAIGKYSAANGDYSIALGSNVRANGLYSIAIGGSINGDYSITIGNQHIYNVNSVLLGNNASIGGNYAVGIGNNTTSDGQSVAVGYKSLARGNAVALGHNANTSFANIALGYNANAGIGNKITYSNCISIGSNSKVITTDGIVIGHNSSVNCGNTANTSFIIGSNSKTDFEENIIIGENVTSKAAHSIIIGKPRLLSKFACYSLNVDGGAIMEVDRENYGLYLRGFGGYNGYNLGTTIGDTESLNTNIKSVQQIINEKADVSAIPTKVSQLTNDSGYLTAHQSLDSYAKKTEIPNVSTKADLVDGKLKAEQLPKLVNITNASTAEEVVTKFNALLADLKAKGYM